MHLHRPLDLDIVPGMQVGVAAADVREGEDALAVALECREEIEDVIAVAVDIGQVFDEGMRRATDRTPFVEEKDVAVAAKMRDRRVLVAGNRDEAARSVELPIKTIELGVELVRDLEVVALMADEIAERLVARVLEVVTGAVGADRLFALGVEVAPPRRSSR